MAQKTPNPRVQTRRGVRWGAFCVRVALALYPPVLGTRAARDVVASQSSSSESATSPPADGGSRVPVAATASEYRRRAVSPTQPWAGAPPTSPSTVPETQRDAIDATRQKQRIVL